METGGDDAAGRRRLRAVTAAAGRGGVRAGMSLAEARALCAGLEVLPWDDVAVAGAVIEMTAMLLEASPQVTPVAGAPGTWWVGASGFRSERALAHALRRVAGRWHPRARVAIADSCVAARAATWAGASFQRGGDDRSLVGIVPRGRDAAYLASAPLVLIPMADDLRETLAALGLRTVGAFAALSAEDVERRWGREGLDIWRLARGEDRRRPVLARVPSRPTVEAELALPTTSMEPVLFLVRAALEHLTTQLAGDGRAVAALAITLGLDDAHGALPVTAGIQDRGLGTRMPDPESRIPSPESRQFTSRTPNPGSSHTVTREIRLARPSARVAPLLERCRALLDGWTLTAPVIGVAVCVVASAPLRGEQGGLLDGAWRDPAAVDAALERLRAELGPNVVVRPVARDTHRPERMGAWEEAGEAALGGDTSITVVPAQAGTDRSSSNAVTAARTAGDSRLRGNDGTVPCREPGAESIPSLRLLDPPESVIVMCDDGAPRSVTWRGRRIAVERAVGPERLSGDWWDDGYRRDYWRCESAYGEFVLYLDRADDEWWMQGWYD